MNFEKGLSRELIFKQKKNRYFYEPCVLCYRRSRSGSQRRRSRSRSGSKRNGSARRSRGRYTRSRSPRSRFAIRHSFFPILFVAIKNFVYLEKNRKREQKMKVKNQVPWVGNIKSRLNLQRKRNYSKKDVRNIKHNFQNIKSLARW